MLLALSENESFAMAQTVRGWAVRSAGVLVLGSTGVFLGVMLAQLFLGTGALLPAGLTTIAAVLAGVAIVRRLYELGGPPRPRSLPMRWRFALPSPQSPQLDGALAILQGEPILAPLSGRPCLAYDVGVRTDDDASQEVPEHLVHAVLAAEDRRFFEHGGLDHRGLVRAALANYRSGTVSQGGSTITQQVAKSFLTDDQTLTRKIREAILSVRIESTLSKEDILEIYLNKIFYGHGAYGVASAASRYFGKDLGELTLAECALIAGLARAPSRYSPVSSPERAEQRRAVVLQDMVEAGYIEPSERDSANEEPIRLVAKPDVFRARAPYYAEHVRVWTEQTLGEQAVLTEGLQIETALVPTMQAEAEAAVDRAVRRIDEKQGFRGPVAALKPDDVTVFLERTAQ